MKRLQLALKIFGTYYDERIHLRMPSLDVADKSLVELEYEEFEKLQAQRQRMRQQSESNQKRKRS